MTVIAIDTDPGSNGDLIAASVAARMGLDLVDDAFLFEQLRQQGLNMPDIVSDTRGDCFPWREAGKKLHSEVLSLAQQERKLLHWSCAPYLLVDIIHIPRIKIRAPLSVRLRRYAARWGCDEQQARRRIAEHERKTRFLFDACFGIAAPLPAATYHLVADTGWLAPSDWADEIIELSADQEFTPTSASRAMLRWLALQLPGSADVPQFAGCDASREC